MAATLSLLGAVLAVAAGAPRCELGDRTNDLPNTLLPAPLLGDLKDVRYLLWTRSNSGHSDYYRLMPGNLTNLGLSPLAPALPTFIMYHGFNDFGECDWILNAKTELLNLLDCNVISVDWSTLVPSPWYNYGVENAYRTANYTARLMDWLEEQTGLQPSQLHITGHSLGAHTAGLTAKYITSGTVARVTGLDPAGPLFYNQPPERRIDKSDADFVDILHSNSGSILEGCIGLFKPVGHVDFYPNGGMHQPGCTISPGTGFDDFEDLFGGCSHSRSTALWVESIVALPPTKPFTSWPCSDWETFFNGSCSMCGLGCLDMGFHAQQGLLGSYFLRTNPTAPFALGDTQ